MFVVSVSSPYAVFRAGDLGWPPPVAPRSPRGSSAGGLAFGASSHRAPTRSRTRRSRTNPQQGELFSSLLVTGLGRNAGEPGGWVDAMVRTSPTDENGPVRPGSFQR